MYLKPYFFIARLVLCNSGGFVGEECTSPRLKAIGGILCWEFLFTICAPAPILENNLLQICFGQIFISEIIYTQQQLHFCGAHLTNMQQYPCK